MKFDPAKNHAEQKRLLHEHFERVKAFYAEVDHLIKRRSDEWMIDPYAWEFDGGIRLTPIEWALWNDIRMENMVMYPQYPVGRYFVDFGNPAAKVAIECDGEQWHTDKTKDAVRQREIETLGWHVYRITGKDCLTEFEEVEDEYGRFDIQVSAAREFVRGIRDRHLVQRIGSRRETRWVGEGLVEWFDKCLVVE